MKKTILSLIAIIAITGFTTASYTGNVSDYYNQNKSDYTINTSVGNITITTPVYNSDVNYKLNVTYNQDKVVCKYSTNMCYSSTDAMRVFGFDVEAFVKGYEKVTGIKTNFVNLYQKLYTTPSL